jgi:hypothetical protein
MGKRSQTQPNSFNLESISLAMIFGCSSEQLRPERVKIERILLFGPWSAWLEGIA